MLRLIIAIGAIMLIPSASASALTPKETLYQQLSSELQMRGDAACNLMSKDYQQMFISASDMLGLGAENCQESVEALSYYRRSGDAQFDKKARRQLRSIKRGRLSLDGKEATVTIRFRGLTPGGPSKSGYITKESYGLVQAGESWLVDAIIDSKQEKIN